MIFQTKPTYSVFNCNEIQIDIYNTLKQLYITWHSFPDITKKQKKINFSGTTASGHIIYHFYCHCIEKKITLMWKNEKLSFSPFKMQWI